MGQAGVGVGALLPQRFYCGLYARVTVGLRGRLVWYALPAPFPVSGVSEAQSVAPEADFLLLRLSEEASRLGGALEVSHQVNEAEQQLGISPVPRGGRGVK